jgi:hypothetical protein
MQVLEDFFQKLKLPFLPYQIFHCFIAIKICLGLYLA